MTQAESSRLPECWRSACAGAHCVPSAAAAQVGDARFATGHFLEAAFLFKVMVTSTELQVRQA